MKIKFNKKRLLALLIGGSLVFCRGAAYLGKVGQAQETVSEQVETNVEVDNILTNPQLTNLNITNMVYLFSEYGDIEATVNVMLRRGPGVENDKFDTILGGHLVKAYGITDNGWYLVSYNGKLGFAHSKYFLNKTLGVDSINFVKEIQKNMVVDEQVEEEPVIEEEVTEEETYESSIYEQYPNVIALDGIMYTNAKVFFRVAPSKSSQDMGVLKKGQEVKLLGFENGWYLVEYQGRVGYIYSCYLSYNPYAKYRDDIIDVVYIMGDTPLMDSASDQANAKYYFSRYEVCEVLMMTDEWYLVRYEDMYGYVRRNCTSKVSNKAVVVDIDAQKLTLYDNNEIIVETDVVTGTLGVFDTPTGIYYIKNKVTNTSLTSDKYGYNQPVDYWMPFNGGIGLHDADWRSKFGGDIYVKNGSHGCVNIPPEYADDVFNNVAYKTRVIVHK